MKHAALPIGPLADSAGNLLFGWDGSRAAEEAIHVAMPMLERAATVTLVQHARAHGPRAEDVAAYLRRRGIAARVERRRASR